MRASSSGTYRWATVGSADLQPDNLAGSGSPRDQKLEEVGLDRTAKSKEWNRETYGKREYLRRKTESPTLAERAPQTSSLRWMSASLHVDHFERDH